MAYEKLVDLSSEITISLGGVNKKTGKPNPKQIEGYYLGSRQVADAKKKTGYTLIYTFQTAQGNVSVWGKTHLDRMMIGATPGVMTKITQNGIRPTPFNDMLLFDVEVDKNNTIDPASLSPPTTLYESDDTDLFDGETPTDEVIVERPVAGNTSVPSAGRRSALQDRLNGTRTKLS